MRPADLSILPALHLLARDPHEAVRQLNTRLHHDARVRSALGLLEICDREDVLLPLSSLARLLLDAYAAGFAGGGASAELLTRVRQSACAVPVREACRCGAEIIGGSVCSGDPKPPRCSKCQHTLAHGACPLCEPADWTARTGVSL